MQKASICLLSARGLLSSLTAEFGVNDKEGNKNNNLDVKILFSVFVPLRNHLNIYNAIYNYIPNYRITSKTTNSNGETI